MKIIAYGMLLLSAAIMSQSMSIQKRDIKDDLKKSIAELREEAKKEIEKLKDEGKLTLATDLDAAEKRLEDIEAQLEKLNPQTEVGKALLHTLEALAKKAEDKLKEEIKKLSGSYYDDDLKNILLGQAKKLEQTAKEAIVKLKKDGRARWQIIETTQKRIIEIDTQIQAVNPDTEVGKSALAVLEGMLENAEAILETEIKKVSGPITVDDLKKILLVQTEKMQGAVSKAIDKLKKEGSAQSAEGLERAQNEIVHIHAQLIALNPNTGVGKAVFPVLERSLQKAEKDLEAEFKKLSGSF